MIHCEAEGLDRLERAAVCERCTASSTVAEVCKKTCVPDLPRDSAGSDASVGYAAGTTSVNHISLVGWCMLRNTMDDA